MHTITQIRLEEPQKVKRKPEIESEREVALADLLAHNHFVIRERKAQGKYAMALSVTENRLRMDVSDMESDYHTYLVVPIKPFKNLIRDYFMICESYFEAVQSANPSRIEALDMGRRGLHNEASELLQSMLKERIEMDLDTARRLFTLICVLHIS